MTELTVDYSGRSLFLDGDVGIARFDTLEYPFIDKLTEQQMSYFWTPQEIQEIIKDKNDFAGLSKHEQHIFTSNLLRQILLDSLQGQAPAEVFGPLASVPELSNWIQAWTFSETVHSRSYTHIIRNVYAKPDDVFSKIPEIKEIVDCATDISKNYDDLDAYNHLVASFGYNDTLFDKIRNLLLRPFKGKNPGLTLYEHKKLLWKCLMSVNILEGIRFYVSFAASWSFAERKLMEGNAKIIKLIARDENLHLASTQWMLREMKRNDPDFAQISLETQDECIAMFQSAIDQEKEWVKYLFKDGSMLGLTDTILNQYVDYIGKQRLKAVDLPNDHLTVTQNPLPWTLKWISGKEMQPAPQETSITSYRTGGVKADLDADSLGKFKL